MMSNSLLIILKMRFQEDSEFRHYCSASSPRHTNGNNKHTTLPVINLNIKTKSEHYRKIYSGAKTHLHPFLWYAGTTRTCEVSERQTFKGEIFKHH